MTKSELMMELQAIRKRKLEIEKELRELRGKGVGNCRIMYDDTHNLWTLRIKLLGSKNSYKFAIKRTLQEVIEETEALANDLLELANDMREYKDAVQET